MKKALLSLGAAAALGALPVTVRAQHAGHGQHGMPHAGSDHAAASTCGHSAGCATHEITVTSEGFVPGNVRVQRGETVKLVVTRKTERTCAKEIVIADYGIRKPLPLDEPVTIEFTPKKSGEVRYACGMDMVSGVLHVE